MSDAVAYNLRDEEADQQASTVGDEHPRLDPKQQNDPHQQNGHASQSEASGDTAGTSGQGAKKEGELASLERDHAPSVEKHEDESSHEVKYTAEVGKIPDDGAGASSGGGKMLLMAAHPQLAQDVRAAFAGVPRVKPQWSDRHLKILIVGESGLGKTTFIKNLLAPYAQDPNMHVNDAPGSEEALAMFKSNPERMCTTVLVNDHSSLTSFHYRVQDTPGYNTLEETKAPIMEYIRGQNALYVEREQDAKRAGPLHRFPDSRVDVALFFIPPHRLRPIDLDFITELSNWVPVVPIMAKADSMTVEELQAFRRDVRESLAQAGKAAKKDLLHAFSEEALDAAGARRDAPPFAVVASTTMDLSVGRFWPVRKYPWGTCEALSSVHSDVGALKRLLFEEGYEELKAATEARYYAYRSEHLLSDPSVPIQKGSIPEHMWRAIARPASGERRRVKEVIGKGLRFLGAAAVFYVGVSYAMGGERRLRKDLDVLQEKGGEAADLTLQKAREAGAAAGDKAQDIGGKVLDVAAQKTDQAIDIAARKTNEAANRAAALTRRKGRELMGAAAEKAGQVKNAVADKFTSEAELERRRQEEEAARLEAEARERASHRWGPFGLFRK